MEACFSQLTLDVIGKAVFNYDFNALNTDSPLIQVTRRLGTASLCALLAHGLHAVRGVLASLSHS